MQNLQGQSQGQQVHQVTSDLIVLMISCSLPCKSLACFALADLTVASSCAGCHRVTAHPQAHLDTEPVMASGWLHKVKTEEHNRTARFEQCNQHQRFSVPNRIGHIHVRVHRPELGGTCSARCRRFCARAAATTAADIACSGSWCIMESCTWYGAVSERIQTNTN